MQTLRPVLHAHLSSLSVAEVLFSELFDSARKQREGPSSKEPIDITKPGIGQAEVVDLVDLTDKETIDLADSEDDDENDDDDLFYDVPLTPVIQQTAAARTPAKKVRGVDLEKTMEDIDLEGPDINESKTAQERRR